MPAVGDSGVCDDPVLNAAPKLVQPLAVRLTDDVSKSYVYARHAPVWRSLYVVAERCRMPLDVERVLSHQVRFHGGQMLWVHGWPDTDDTLVRVVLHDGPAALSKGHTAAYVPGRLQRPYLVHRSEIDYFYISYMDSRALVHGRFLTVTFTQVSSGDYLRLR